MAKNIDKISAVEASHSALKETEQKKCVKVTQKSGNHPIVLKKFPEAWFKAIKSNHAGSVSDYFLIAVAEKMRRDGIFVEIGE